MQGYSVKILETDMQLSAKEKVMLKDTDGAIKLDDATKDGPVIIDPKGYVILGIHNEFSDNTDYEVYLIVDKNGTKYTTGSPSFWDSYTDIVSEMGDVTDEEWKIKVHRLPSKNRSGKEFITCSIV